MPRMRRRTVLITALALPALCLLLAGVSAIVNSTLPDGSQDPDRLTAIEKAHAEEALHLKQAGGAALWPAWSAADIPVLLYNERNAFLLAFGEPPTGWIAVEGDDFLGKPYYRRAWPKPQAFAEQIDTRWVGSLATYEWMRIALRNQVRSDLPGPLQPVFPYWLAMPLFTSDWHITGILHETAHAFAATQAPRRFDAALASYRDQDRYPWDDAGLQGAWQTELDLLADALQTTSDQAAADLARQFLTQRTERRQTYALTPASVNFERQIEWLEGLGKYVELGAWRAGSRPDYAPVSSIAGDGDFKRYSGFSARWDEELKQMRGLAGRPGDMRFYYTGMAQAMLLDRLAPGWQARIMDDGVWPEDLLAATAAP
jgi:hypothetical protein